jgi:type IV pilus assembly protein PilB
VILGQEEDRATDPVDQDKRRRLGEVLVDHGAITAEQLSEALLAQRAATSQGRRVRLGPLLSELGYASDRQIAAALADALSLELVDLGAVGVSSEITRMLPRTIAERHLVLPFAQRDGQLIVAFADPTNVIALDDVKAYIGSTQVSMVVAAEGQVRDQLARVWSLSEDSSAVATMLEDLDSEGIVDTNAADLGMGTSIAGDADAPTVRLVNVILADAVRARVSDIHIEPQQNAMRVRYRVDGLLRDVMTLPRGAGAGVVSRIKVMSNLDIAERRLPQDGRARLKADNVTLDARISTLPSLLGEKVVIRLLSKADEIPAITKLGLDDHQLETLLGSVVAPQGLILITGPTGSGKTGTLYSAISQIKTVDRNVITLEDPVEMQVTGITQVQVSERTGLTFNRGLRSVLRQDPDVVLVGEVRDGETAKLALEASLTGHLVLTTLHTNSAPAAVSRLVDMGVEPFLVASSLSLVVAQRLVRRVCDTCAAPYQPSSRVRALLGLQQEDLDAASPRRGAGCVDCGETGYRGRTGVFEVLPITAALREVLMSTGNEGAIAAAARQAGMQTMRAAAIAKANAGITTYDEVLRVTQVDQTGDSQCAVCGGAVTEDMVACPWCSATIDRGHCTGCDRSLEPGWRTCPWCRTPVGGSSATDASDGAGLPRLLVVDEDPAMRAFVTTTLLGSLEVDAVGTATEALDLVSSGSYDGMLVDSRLPDLTGVEVLRLLRNEAQTAALPVMLVSGEGQGSVEGDARAAGADDFLRKPFEADVLEERMLALVARSARRSAAATG